MRCLKSPTSTNRPATRARVRLNVDTPFLRVESESFKSPLAAKLLDLVNELVASVVTGAGKTWERRM